MDYKQISALILGLCAAITAFAPENGFWPAVIMAVAAATILGGC